MLLLAVLSGAQAAPVTGLYQAEAPVAGRTAEQRGQAISDAFVKVLVKVTGSRGVAAREALKEDVANATRYVQQYSYRTESGATDESNSFLLVSFDAQAVDRLLRERGLPVWGGNRPSVLLWLGLEEKGKRSLLTPEQGLGIRPVLEATAVERGLPLLFPLMDLEDRGQLQVSDLWGEFEADISKASQRYAPDLILTGRLAQVARGLWRGQWRLYQGRNSIAWNNQAKSRDALAADGLQHAADLLASRFAPTGGGSALTGVRLKVAGVESLADYVEVDRLLRSQSSLERAQLVTVSADAVIYQLQLRGGLQALQQGLELGGLIEPDPALAGSLEAPSDDIDLRYRKRR